MQQTFDVVIVGAGVIGLACALKLSQHGISVCVIEKNSIVIRWDGTQTEKRVSAINYQSKNFFESLGVWDEIVAKRVSAYQKMHVWDAQSIGKITFEAHNAGFSELGFIVENDVMRAALLQELQRNMVTVVDNACIDSMTFHDESVELLISSGTTLRANCLIGADGAQSSVRDQLGIEAGGWSYQQSALVTTVKTARTHDRTAWQRFLPTGPLAFLPLQDLNLSSIVWSLPEARANELSTMEVQAFNHLLEENLAGVLGATEAIQARFVFPLRMQHANQYTLKRAALIGDAIHTIHPLAGLGMNLGLKDASTLANVLISARGKKRDIGSLVTLRKFERARKADNLKMIGLMEAFKRGFGSQWAAARFSRGAALRFVDKCVPIKHYFMREAMGIYE